MYEHSPPPTAEAGVIAPVVRAAAKLDDAKADVIYQTSGHRGFQRHGSQHLHKPRNVLTTPRRTGPSRVLVLHGSTTFTIPIGVTDEGGLRKKKKGQRSQDKPSESP